MNGIDGGEAEEWGMKTAFTAAVGSWFHGDNHGGNGGVSWMELTAMMGERRTEEC